MKWRLTFASSAALLASTVASAFPYVESPSVASKIEEGATGGEMIYYRDSEDPKLIYLPYDEIAVATNPRTNTPIFSFAYSENGGLINITVHAQWSEKRSKMKDQLVSRGYTVTPLSPSTGGWALTVGNESKEYMVGLFESAQTVDPSTNSAFTKQLERNSIYYIAYTMAAGASLAVDYVYSYRGIVTPLKFNASVHWTNFRRIVQDERFIETTRCSSSTSTNGWWLWKDSTSTTACGQNFEHIKNLVQIAIERGVIKIHSTQFDDQSLSASDEQKRLVSEITNLVMAKQFRPVQSLWSPINPIPNDRRPACSASGSGRNWSASCEATSSTHVWNTETIWEDREYSYEVVSNSIVSYNGRISGSLNVMCNDYPDLFIYTTTGAKGCPTFTEQRIQPTQNVPEPTNDDTRPPVNIPPNPFGR